MTRWEYRSTIVDIIFSIFLQTKRLIVKMDKIRINVITDLKVNTYVHFAIYFDIIC